VRVDASGSRHLTYCTNIHAADGWDAVLTNVRRFAPALKQRFSPAAPFGIGLRLSARDARELLQGHRLDEFQAFLADAGLYVALINGFPYGSFHRTAVKADVYAPDWRDNARVRYTLDLVEILARLLPDHVDGGISTAPLTYKRWMPADGSGAWPALIRNIVRVVEAMARLWERRAIVIHLDLEPEPDCLIETTDEFLDFFERRLLPDGGPLLAARLGCDVARARTHLRNHVRLCFDCCHYAVEFEDPAEALRRVREAGVYIGRIQLSSALKVTFPDDPSQCSAVVERLLRFADSTYLHQVIEKRDGTLEHYPDLDVALATRPTPTGAEWRIHFHVPLFTAEYDGLGSTQDYVRQVIALASSSRAARHFEIETYTWDVLPAGLKIDLLDSIAREYEWVLESFNVTHA
jgi:sugar phosphate isomerase/epimerase